MEKKLNDLLKKYYNKSDDCNNFLRYEEDVEYWIDEEVKELFKKENINASVELVDAYEKSSICVKILVIAYIEDSKMKLITKRLLMF